MMFPYNNVNCHDIIGEVNDVVATHMDCHDLMGELIASGSPHMDFHYF